AEWIHVGGLVRSAAKRTFPPRPGAAGEWLIRLASSFTQLTEESGPHAVAFGGVHRKVGAPEQFRRRMAIFRIDSDTHAGADPDILTVHIARLPELGGDARSQ